MKALTFGRYEALFHIASGGMAEVFAARAVGPANFEELVAVKRLLPGPMDERFATMFRDEARIASQISSPHVVQTLELGRDDDDGALYIVMELVIGVTLFDLCVSTVEGHRRNMPVPVVAEIVAQAARGIDDAHDATNKKGEPLQVVHRDVSPQNLLCGIDGRVRVTDFGIARARSRSTETRAGQLKGKVAYVSPEQARGKRLDRRSDVFSLGIVAWEALTGKSLFNMGEPNETLKRLLNMPIPDPRQFRNDVSPELASAIVWALERDVEKRCPSAARFERAVREGCPGLPQRKLGAYVERYGGKTLDHMLSRLSERKKRPTLTLSPPASTTRLVPEASVSSNRLIGEPTGGQRDIETEELRSPEVVPGYGQRRSKAQSQRARVALAVGLAAWLLAALVVYLALQKGPSRSAHDPLQLEGQP